MQIYPKTLIIRHKRENLKKCSLRGLESRSDMIFFKYPFENLPPLNNYVMLVMEGAEELKASDADKGLLLLDSTWRYLSKMIQAIPEPVEKRVLPSGYRTAYPRRQDDCEDPERGLSTLEALYIAYTILDRPTEGLLDNYHWKDQFLILNNLQG